MASTPTARPGANQAPSRARLAAALGGHLPPPGARIGLLGGSFNPAHSGHRDLSLEALRRLGLDEVWWLVSPQNPLKPRDQMASLETRLAGARRLAKHRKIRVTGIEAALDTRYTADTLALLRRRFPRVRFVWLMGADNLVQMANWSRWRQIFDLVVVAVFDRPAYSLRATAARAARCFARFRARESGVKLLVDKAPPAWTFIHGRLNAQSATGIRAKGGARGTGAQGVQTVREK